MQDLELTHRILGAAMDVHRTFMVTYLGMSETPLGLFINFHAPVLKDGTRRDVWHCKENDNAAAQNLADVCREAVTAEAQPRQRQEN